MHPGIGSVGVNAVVELVVKFVALSVAGQVRNGGILVVFVDVECNYANFVPGFDGGSSDTDRRDGEECCEEVLIEHYRCRRAESEMRGR